MSKEKFKQHFLKKDISEFNKLEIEFYHELDLYIKEKSGTVVNDVIKDYKTLKKHLQGFDEFTLTISTFNTINYTYYKNWINYLAFHMVKKNGETGLKNNTIGKLVKNLKAFLNDRIRSKRIAPIDLKDFKVIQEEVDHIYLNKEEIKSISNINCKGNNTKEKVKDFFVIGCLTGLRFSDIIRIKPDYIKNGFLEMRQKKLQGK